MAYDLPPPPYQAPTPPPAYSAGPGATDVPLDQPLYGATFRQALSRFFRKYAVFTGRASLSEMWWAYLAQVLGVGVFYVLLIVLSVSLTDPRTGEIPDDRAWPIAIPGLFLLVITLGTFLPMLAVIVRRLHDTGRPGWWYLITFVPLGSIVLLVFLCQNSTVTGFAFDSRNGQPSLAVNPILRGQVGGFAPGGWGGPAGYGAPAFGPPQGGPGYGQPPQDAPTYGQPPQDRPY
ncbi:hypothetical protein C8046_08005 [Serinibacter arcticus]|uniref:Integral membrane protein n=1 Tax=Serinibacter arcticus TaxID=1655435 RepID=A0A2U1ZZP3_9MICO|nr:DUF805 domain-containing protein [Serinibacter arcticus]PWD52449.1 hypothetical protein C8046_08005 [Serinibacter arcticus]